jgi:hypothetical protein
MKEGKNNEHEHWFSRCVSLGWSRARGDGGEDSVTSPRGVSIAWDPEARLFRWDILANRDFRRLVNLVIHTLDAGVHDNRVKIAAVRLTTRELVRVLDEEDSTPSYLDDWKDDGGRKSLEFFVGPLGVDASIEPGGDGGVAWVALLSNGKMQYSGCGVDKDEAAAKASVYERLLEWCDEISDTGRNAIKLATRIKDVSEKKG